jgi:hypothetical protein
MGTESRVGHTYCADATLMAYCADATVMMYCADATMMRTAPTRLWWRTTQTRLWCVLRRRDCDNACKHSVDIGSVHFYFFQTEIFTILDVCERRMAGWCVMNCKGFVRKLLWPTLAPISCLESFQENNMKYLSENTRLPNWDTNPEFAGYEFKPTPLVAADETTDVPWRCHSRRFIKELRLRWQHCFSETSAKFQRTTRRCIPEDGTLIGNRAVYSPDSVIGLLQYRETQLSSVRTHNMLMTESRRIARLDLLSDSKFMPVSLCASRKRDCRPRIGWQPGTALLDTHQLDDLQHLHTQRGAAMEHPLFISALLLCSRHEATSCSGLMPSDLERTERVLLRIRKIYRIFSNLIRT